MDVDASSSMRASKKRASPTSTWLRSSTYTRRYHESMYSSKPSSPSQRYRYECMRLDRIREILKTCPVAVQPSGLLEWHGEHNAIGLDGLKAYYICERTMELLGDGALMPINWVGTYGFTRYPGSVVFDQDTTFSVFVQLYQQLIKIGFKVVFVLTGHYGYWQMHELNRAKAFVEQELAKKQVNGVRLAALRPPDLSLGLFGGDHAQRYETSMLWRAGQAWGTDLVDVRGCKVGEERPPWYALPDENVPLREPDPWTWQDDLANPSVCSSDFGEKIISRIATVMAHEIIELLNDVGIKYTPPRPLPEP